MELMILINGYRLIQGLGCKCPQKFWKENIYLLYIAYFILKVPQIIIMSDSSQIIFIKYRNNLISYFNFTNSQKIYILRKRKRSKKKLYTSFQFRVDGACSRGFVMNVM